MNNTILAIDDTPRNLKLLESYLLDTDYTVITAASGAEGLELLKQHKDDIKVIVLDRMMPNMSGIDFMKIIKSDMELRYIPVIMQTAAAEVNQVIEGIQSGVYYYLTKPYSEELLLSIVKSAVNDYINKGNLVNEAKKHKYIARMVKKGEFQLRTPQDVECITPYLANFFPNAERVTGGIMELLINAIEHGNLGIGYDLKTTLNYEGNLAQEIEHRLQLPENINKFVHILYECKGDSFSLTVQDEGNGFDWQQYMKIDPERATHSHGRGIAIANIIHFDNIQYLGNGNTVVATVNRSSTVSCFDDGALLQDRKQA